MNNKQIEFKMELCEHKTIKHFCENYHYSKTAPASIYKFLFVENAKEVGVITFGRGANRNIAKPFNLEQENVLELTRVAFNKHHNYLSSYISKCIKHIKQQDKNVKLIISYADKRQLHDGVLYKACSFNNDGERKMNGIEYYDEIKERWCHQRNLWNHFKERTEDKSHLSFKDYVLSLGYKIREQSPKIRFYKYIR